MLILDSSGSIGDNAKNVTDAARGFLTALAGTGSQVAIVDFDETATLAVPYNLVTTANIERRLRQVPRLVQRERRDELGGRVQARR